MNTHMDSEVASFFRDQFRQARATALQDAEGFQEIIFVLERFGAHLIGKIKDLGKYGKAIEREAMSSPLQMPSQFSTMPGILSSQQSTSWSEMLGTTLYIKEHLLAT